MISYRKEVEARVALQALDDRTGNVHELATDCDRLRKLVAENARYMERQFRVFAAKAERGESLYSSTPLSTSAALDIVRDAAALDATAKAFAAAYRAEFGLQAWKDLQAKVQIDINDQIDAAAGQSK